MFSKSEEDNRNGLLNLFARLSLSQRQLDQATRSPYPYSFCEKIRSNQLKPATGAISSGRSQHQEKITPPRN